MAKNETRTNSKGEQGKVLENVAAAVTAPAAAVGEGNGKAKKNQKIEVLYLDKDGKETGSLQDVRQIKVVTKGGVDETIDLSSLPKNIMVAAAVFGLNTAARNTHNTNEAGGKDGSAALKSRLANWRNGEWASIGGGDGEEGVPLVIEAMIRAKKDKGQYSEGMEEKWLTEYRSLDQKAKAEWTKQYSAKPSINIALLTIRAERAAAKAQAAAGNTTAAGDDF